MTISLRQDCDIPAHDLGGSEVRPRIALVGGMCGNELNAVFVLARLAAFLKAVVAGERLHRLCGRVIILPAVNVPGLTAHGLGISSTEDPSVDVQRIVSAVLAKTRDAYYRIDIRSASLNFEDFPQVYLYTPHDDERVNACLFGLPVVERPLNASATPTLNSAWRAFGGENFVIQAGRAGGLQRRHCERLFRALVAFLLRTGIVEGPPLCEAEEDLHYFNANQAFPLITDRAGLFVSMRETGCWLQAGDVVGHLYDGFEGEVQAEVRTPVSGLLTGLRRQPLLDAGNLIARIYSHESLGERSDAWQREQE